VRRFNKVNILTPIQAINKAWQQEGFGPLFFVSAYPRHQGSTYHNTKNSKRAQAFFKINLLYNDI
jgi:hypothetical protein